MQLDFQTGVAPKTLVFGYVRWVDWSDFSVEPPVYGQATAALLGQPRPLIAYDDDWWTYNLGVGRQLTAFARRLLLDHLGAGRRRRDDLARPVRRPHHRHAALTYEVGKFDITGGLTYGSPRRHPQPARRPTSTTARSGAPASAIGYTF